MVLKATVKYIAIATKNYGSIANGLLKYYSILFSVRSSPEYTDIMIK